MDFFEVGVSANHLLRADAAVKRASPLHHSTTPPLHHSPTPPLHHSATPPLHHSTTPPLHHSTTPPLHHSTTPHPPFPSLFQSSPTQATVRRNVLRITKARSVLACASGPAAHATRDYRNANLHAR